MSSKPTIVFVPGAWHTPECFELVETRLKSAGYEYIGVRTPSVCKESPFPKDGRDDVEAVRTALNSALGDGNDVVVVMHSYGGFPGSAACKGMSKEDRMKGGKKGGVIRLVYIASFAIPEGTNLSGGNGTNMGEQGLADWCIIEVRCHYFQSFWTSHSHYTRAITCVPNAATKFFTTISQRTRQPSGPPRSNTMLPARSSHHKRIRPSNSFLPRTSFASWTMQFQLLSKR
jgi:pimeloyl-ACP methyl ester carboxylesterase